MAQASERIELARDGRTSYTIVGDGNTFAAQELASYLKRMSGATFRVAQKAGSSHVIALRVAKVDASPDAYSITARGDSIVLTGSTPRAVLFASYDLLKRLGCRFIAPQLAFYEGRGEIVPQSRRLIYVHDRDVSERPTFAMRKLNVEEGLSHDTTSLKAIVAWMPKARFNTISVPLDYGGGGRVKWDNWRAVVAPELQRRGIDIEVGGHGYQNFLNAKMDGGDLFAKHPDWFGQDSTCKPSRAPENVFNSANRDAVSHVVTNVVRYMRERPEIDILELWPPDGARWAACASSALPSASDRQATLLNTVSAALRATRPDVRVQSIAYSEAKEPPTGVTLDPSIIMDVCPIGQNFDVQIDDPRGTNNAQYVALIRDWRARFNGHVGLYAYYRRYAWLSLPVLLPRYMQHDLRWYAGVPLQGISSYAEPADWYTYELNHYALGELAWNPNTDLTTLIDEYVAMRYGPDARAALDAITTLEDVVRRYGSIQYAAPKNAAEIQAARERIDSSRREVQRSRSLTAFGTTRLALMLEYASRDLAIQESRVAGDTTAARARVDDLTTFLTANGTKGVFLLTGRNDRARIYRHYAMKAD